MSPRKKLLIAIGLFIGTSLLFIILALIFRQVNPTQTNTTDLVNNTSNQYVDADSGETVITSNNTPEALENGPLVLGVKKFIEYGMTSYQFTNMMASITDYTKTAKVGSKNITKFSVIVSTIRQPIDPNSDSDVFNASVKINDSVTEYMTVTSTTVYGEFLVVNIYDKEGGTLLYTTPPYTQDSEV